MLLKTADDKEYVIKELEKLLASSRDERKRKIEHELRMVRAGIKGERDAAYLIDFDYKDTEGSIVLHDLRLEIGGRVAQIDHLILDRMLYCHVLETKQFHSGIKITEDGEFLRWNDYKKTYEGMASPLAQNERHLTVLRQVFGQINMPTRLGIRLSPRFQSFVLISPNARIDRPAKFDTSQVIKADALRATLSKQIDQAGPLEVFGSLSKTVSVETLQAIGRELLAFHKPIAVDIAAKFGVVTAPLPEPPVAVAKQPDEAKAQCRACGSDSVTILYGKYGYYFKCKPCDGNTPVRVHCGQAGHKERLRKEGPKFYRECADCSSSMLYFVNPA